MTGFDWYGRRLCDAVQGRVPMNTIASAGQASHHNISLYVSTVLLPDEKSSLYHATSDPSPPRHCAPPDEAPCMAASPPTINRSSKSPVAAVVEYRSAPVPSSYVLSECG
jgi:hypothetical protein